jgi:glycerol uptake facilitator-like aquaporin
MGITRLAWRALRQLFHEMTGALFLCFAVLGALAAYDQWHDHAARWVFWLAIGYAAMMVIFGVSAFRTARRIR